MSQLTPRLTPRFACYQCSQQKHSIEYRTREGRRMRTCTPCIIFGQWVENKLPQPVGLGPTLPTDQPLPLVH